jgi:hypothetical protein
MEKIKKLPLYVPALGMVASYVLIIIVAFMPNTPLLIAGMILLHLSGWLLAVKFFLCGAAFFSSVLNTQ